jgi:hypothetical protein
MVDPMLMCTGTEDGLTSQQPESSTSNASPSFTFNDNKGSVTNISNNTFEEESKPVFNSGTVNKNIGFKDLTLDLKKEIAREISEDMERMETQMLTKHPKPSFDEPRVEVKLPTRLAKMRSTYFKPDNTGTNSFLVLLFSLTSLKSNGLTNSIKKIYNIPVLPSYFKLNIRYLEYFM